MKRTFIAWAFLMGLSLFVAPRAVALTLEDVINMSNIGVADSVIISAIEASDTVFHLTANDIIELTRAGVSQAVIEALQKTAKKAAPAQTPATQAPSAPPPQRGSPQPEPPAVSPPPPPAPKPAPAQQPRTMRPTPHSASRTPSRPRSQPLPADVKQLKRRYDTGKYTSAANMAYDLLTGPNKDRYAAVRSTIYYYLGKSLYKLGFYHSAHTIFLRVAKEGPASPHYNGCLSLLTRTSDILKEYDGFMSVLEGVPTSNLPRRVRSTLLYLIGLNQYLNEDFSDAANTLDGVSVNSRFYAKAQFITGMAYYRMEQNRKAVQTFRDLVEARQLVGEPDEIRDIQDLAVLNMARIYYRVQDFDRAELLFDLVPRDSKYWPVALYEMAYANFWQSDYNVALGLLLTVHSPFFAGKYYLPEVDILEALVYFNLCEYDRVQRIIKPYQNYTKHVRDTIRTFRKTYGIAIQGDMDAFHRDPRAMEAAMKAYAQVYRSAPPGQALGIPTEVMASVESQRDFQNLHHHLYMIRKEMALLEGGRTKWKGTALGNTLLHTLKQDAAQVRADAGRFLLVQLSQVEVDLSYLLRQSEIIYLEVVKAQKEEYEDRFRNPEYVETYEQLEHSYATESRYIFWPFTGEFWRDELGYYRFTEHGSCRTRASAQ